MVCFSPRDPTCRPRICQKCTTIMHTLTIKILATISSIAKETSVYNSQLKAGIVIRGDTEQISHGALGGSVLTESLCLHLFLTQRGTLQICKLCQAALQPGSNICSANLNKKQSNPRKTSTWPSPKHTATGLPLEGKIPGRPFK